ncbi:phage holin family protein [Elizabethkingia ursingii]|uniref:phage holin family protein n=1 Tax=Elizabethkingia ursingii TaxID=1756150 RepID=UPI002012F34E|nr:phage holin family protein [Elizabethkingia ursingii]MCL1666384.1 phage holin family protein [Elizabethkingia ursingii]MCL1673614.1 phage holin family protein [Elizabethkingia ursingii]
MIRLSDYVVGENYRGIFSFSKYALYGLFAYLNIEAEVITILSVLMIIDTFCGITKSLRLGNKFNISVMAWGFTTKFLILIIPLVVALMGKPLHKDFTWAVDVTIRVLIVNEGLSILANIASVYSQKNIQNVDLISRLIAWIRSLFISMAEKFMQNIKVNSDKGDTNPDI